LKAYGAMLQRQLPKIIKQEERPKWSLFHLKANLSSGLKKNYKIILKNQHID
jgi:hypothetical protein